MAIPVDINATRELLRQLLDAIPSPREAEVRKDVRTLLTTEPYGPGVVAGAVAAGVSDDSLVEDGRGAVFLVRDGRRYQVPDEVTLGILEQGRRPLVRLSTAAIAGIADDGRFPSLDISGLYYTEDAGAPLLVYVERGRAYRVEPDDPSVQSFGPALPLDAVLEQIGVSVLLDTIQPLRSMVAAGDRWLEIRNYLQTIPPPAITDPPGLSISPGQATTREYEGSGGVRYAVDVAQRTIRNVVQQFPALSPVSDVIWPGALLQGNSLTSGLLAPIQIGDRSEGSITISTEIVPGEPSAPTSARIPQPSIAEVTTARRQLISDLALQASAGRVTFDVATVRDENQASAQLGARVTGSGWSASANVSVAGSLDESKTVLKLTQEFYTVTFDPAGSPARYFTDDVTADMLKQFSGPGNAPCYVHQVTYGRIVLLVIESSISALEVKAQVQAAWQASVSGDVNAQAQIRNQTSSYRVQLASVGVTGRTAFQTLGGLVDTINALASTANIGSDNPGEVISYSARYLIDGTLASAVLGPFTYTAFVRADIPVDSYGFEVWDDRHRGVNGGVPVGVTLRPGDRVTVTARGSVNAGWVFGSSFGPAGDTSERGRTINNDTKPLRDAPYTSLLYGFGQGWIYWSDTPAFVYGTDRVGGPGGSLIGSATTPLPMYMTINDDELLNGSGKFEGEIYVQRRPLPGVGDT
jgi:hypothetical protein